MFPNENNLIHQMHFDEKNENKMNFIEYVQMINKIKYNSFNNETGKTAYLNDSDIRQIIDEKYLTPREVGIYLENKNHLRIGNCKRQTFLKINGVLKAPMELNFVEYIERNQLIIEQWIKKFKFCDVLRETEEPEVKTIMGLNVKCFEDYYIYDYVKEKEYLLVIKPVNDAAFPIKDRIFTGNKIMLNDICELVIDMLYYCKPIKLIYVGKNNSEAYKEFHIGINNGFLTVDGEEYTDVDVKKIIIDGLQLQDLIESETIPKVDYLINKPMDMQNLQDMVKKDIITSRTANNLINFPYTSYQCNLCPYRNLCEEIGEDYKPLSEVIK